MRGTTSTPLAGYGQECGSGTAVTCRGKTLFDEVDPYDAIFTWDRDATSSGGGALDPDLHGTLIVNANFSIRCIM